MELCAEALWAHLQNEDLEAFAVDIYRGLGQGRLSLAQVQALLLKLQERQLFYDYDDEAEQDQYLSVSSILSCGFYFVLQVLAWQVKTGAMTREGAVLRRKDQCLDLCRLRQCLQEQAREAEEACSPSRWLKTLEDGDDFGTQLQETLLERFQNEHAALIMVMVYYLRNVKTLGALEAAQTVDISGYTKAEMQNLHAKRIYQTYCFFFLEQACPEENRQMNRAMKNIKEAETADGFVMAVSVADIWVQKWFDGLPMLPFSTYKLLTDGQYHVQFLNVETLDVDAWCDQDAGNEIIAGLLSKARAGDANAQDLLGTYYLVGKEVEKNERKACFWLQKAAGQGVATAQVNYGCALQKGLGGLRVDPEGAVQWFRKAAEQNQDVAQYNLGLAYSTGNGVAQNPAEAEKWFRLAADNGNTMAKLILQNGLVIK